MNRSRPFTLIAAIIFGIMALLHLYRLVTHYRIVLGSHAISEWVSIVAILVTGLLAVMLYRESRS
jgi:hypothetical protein